MTDDLIERSREFADLASGRENLEKHRREIADRLAQIDRELAELLRRLNTAREQLIRAAGGGD